jgi:hypothetical protein
MGFEFICYHCVYAANASNDATLAESHLVKNLPFSTLNFQVHFKG